MHSILLAEDEPHVARMMRMTLEKQGYQVTHAPNGEVARDMLQVGTPDVLITDIAMPKMTGRELCEWVHAEMPQRDFLIFVLTSRTELEHREWTSKIPHLEFMEKPISTKKLLARLADHFATSDNRD